MQERSTDTAGVFPRATAVAAAMAALMVGGAAAAAPPPRISGDRLQFVDCLLPGQLRKLGGQMMYQGPRRPARATVDECEIRGGEYVAYDRADYGTALHVWLPEAEKGNLEAQVYVGEIYERGAGAGPDYAMASRWYAKAADAGNVQGKNHLAYLYEQGLGVPQDPVRALNLYREAAGLSGERLILSSELTQRQEELTARLEGQTQALQQAAGELDRTREQLKAQRDAAVQADHAVARLRTQLAAAQRETTSNNEPEVAALHRQLSERDQRLEEERRAITSLEQTSRQQAERLAQQVADAEREDQRLRAALGESQAQALNARSQLAGIEARAAALEQAAAQARDEAKKLEQASPARPGEPQSQRAVAQSLEEERRGLSQQIQALQQSVAALRSAASPSTAAAPSAPTALRAQLASLENERLVRAREVTELTLRVQADASELADTRAGLVQAQGRLSSQDEQLQKLHAQAEERETQVQKERAIIMGLEAAMQTQQSQIAELRTRLSAQVIQGTPEQRADPVQPRPLPHAVVDLDAKALGLGNSFALIIANGRYRDASLKPLPSVEKDAAAIEGALQRYGFRGHIRHVDNGTRDDIMNALAAFSAQLGPTDSAFIYFSGHGSGDGSPGNDATYWLPSDADPALPASWVPTAWVTEMIGQMKARHVLVVVDSCYAGPMVHNTNLRAASRNGASDPERLRFLAQLRSRTVLTSGGDEPVTSAASGGNSVFASQLTQLLEHNSGVLDASSLHEALASAMNRASRAGGEEPQVPRYSVLANTSHLNGDFLFVPASGL